MINDDVLEMDYLDFDVIVQCDLMLAKTDGAIESLDNICSSKLNINKIDLPHTQIAEKYDQGDPILMKYAMVDAFLTMMLFVTDPECLELFIEQQKILGSPWDLSISRKQSHQTKLLRYRYERFRGVKSVASIRPKTSFAYPIYAKNITKFFISGFNECELPNNDWGMTMQLAKDFTNGNCKLNTCLNKMPFDFHIVPENTNNMILPCLKFNDDIIEQEYFTLEEFEKSFLLFQSLNKSCFKKVTTTHLMAFLWWLIIPRSLNFLKPLNYLRNIYSQQYGRIYLQQFDEFLIYLITIRRNVSSLSPFEEISDTLKKFKKYHKMFSKGNFTWLEDFLLKHIFIVDSTTTHHLLPQKTIDIGFLKIINSIPILYRKCSNTIENIFSYMIDFIKSNTKSIEINNLSFAGAFLVPPCTGMAPTPISIIDVESEYPNALLGSNLDNGCVVDLDEILLSDDILTENIDYRVFNTKRCDDFISWRTFYLILRIM